MYRDVGSGFDAQLVKEVEKKAHQNLHELKTSFAVAGGLPRSRESSLKQAGGRFWKATDEMHEKKHDMSNLSNCSTALKSSHPRDYGLQGLTVERRGSGTLPGSPKHSYYSTGVDIPTAGFDHGVRDDLGRKP